MIRRLRGFFDSLMGVSPSRNARKALMDFGKIDPKDFDVVVCVKGKAGRLFEDGEDTTKYVKKVELSHEAGERAELTVKRHVNSK